MKEKVKQFYSDHKDTITKCVAIGVPVIVVGCVIGRRVYNHKHWQLVGGSNNVTAYKWTGKGKHNGAILGGTTEMTVDETSNAIKTIMSDNGMPENTKIEVMFVTLKEEPKG